MTASPSPRLHLLIDADDTLWENNIYFEAAIQSFHAFVAPCRIDEEPMRELLHRFELDEIEKHGYGLKGFHTAMQATARHLYARPLTADEELAVERIARSIVSRPVELIAGVADTLPRLAARHQLLLVTKGDPSEQLDKLRRSGLAPYFDVVEVLPEKNAAAYRHLVERHSLDAARAWMIGNSPKSDVNASLAADLNAVYIPHSSVWVHERADLAVPSPTRQRLELNAFAELDLLFAPR